MRRNSCTVIVLASPVPAEVLGTVDRSMNVTLVRPADPAGSDGAASQAAGHTAGQAAGRAASRADIRANGLAAAAGALRRAASITSPYALVTADPLAAVAEGWREMWDLARPQGPSRFEQEASAALTAWRAGQFELPDYYLVVAGAAEGATASAPVDPGAAEPSGQADQLFPDFYLGPLRAARPHRVAFVPAAQPAEQAAGVLQALGSLRHGPWWPSLDALIDTARNFYPGHLATSGHLASRPPSYPPTSPAI
jgi:hypothetical protein